MSESVSRLPAGRLFGAAVRRREDPRLITGRGRDVADLGLPGMLALRDAFVHDCGAFVSWGIIVPLITSVSRGGGVDHRADHILGVIVTPFAAPETKGQPLPA